MFMHKLRLFWVVVLISLLSPMVVATEPVNIDLLKNKIVRYYESGEYVRDADKVAQGALFYLNAKITAAAKVSTPPQKKLAIVFDIDDTVLSSYPCRKKLDFANDLSQLKKCEQEGKFPVVPTSLKIYNFAAAHQVAVIFISGRKEDERAATAKNLQDAGFAVWQGLYLKPQNSKEKTALYKERIRKKLNEAGYNIVLNIGDQRGDFMGGYAERSVQMPNPMYIIP